MSLFSPYYIGTTLNLFSLLIVASSGAFFALKTKSINLGGEGQVYLGGFVTAIILGNFANQFDMGIFGKSCLLIFALVSAFASGMILMLISILLKKVSKIDAKPSTKVKSLSGGMLQRLILQRELSFGGDFMIFSNPTSGLDFAGIEELVFTLEKLKKEGKAILVLSVDDVQIEKISNLCISI